MTTLSILIYLAGVTETLKTVISIVFVSLAVLSPPAFVFLIVQISENGVEKTMKSFSFFKGVKKWLIGGLLCLTLLPSAQTIYMIAGVEAANTIVTSEEGKEVFNDVKEILKEQVKELKKE